MTKSDYFLTPVKRSHLASTSSVGSFVRTRSGVTGLIAGLREWLTAIPIATVAQGIDKDHERERYLLAHILRDHELEAACGVSRFIEPPKTIEESNHKNEWIIPVVRFPLAGVCENTRCRLISTSPADSGKVTRCTECSKPGKGRRKYGYPVQQMAILLVCEKSHIDEINWSSLVTHAPNCSKPVLQLLTGDNLRRPKIKCTTCDNRTEDQDLTFSCTGTRPWLPGTPNEICDSEMHVVERTSVKLYYPQVKTSIHIPADTALREVILLWIRDFVNLDQIDPESERSVNGVMTNLINAGFKISFETTKAHLTALISEFESSKTDTPEWDGLASRKRELDVLTGILDFPNLHESNLLDFEQVDISALDPKFFGPYGLFSQVTAIHRLTETRVIDGFTRWVPSSVTPDRGHELMWGHHRKADSWFLGYRVHGEGVLLTLNPAAIEKWDILSGLDVRKLRDSPSRLSKAGAATHTLAHCLMSELSNNCGYPLAGMRDRIYDLPNGRQAMLIYTAEGDSLGTLGGLVEYAFGTKLEDALERALNEAEWCAQDPVCINTPSDLSKDIGGACHQCALLPETSCERFNNDLDRALLIGNSERSIRGILQNDLN